MNTFDILFTLGDLMVFESHKIGPGQSLQFFWEERESIIPHGPFATLSATMENYSAMMKVDKGVTQAFPLKKGELITIDFVTRQRVANA